MKNNFRAKPGGHEMGGPEGRTTWASHDDGAPLWRRYWLIGRFIYRESSSLLDAALYCVLKKLCHLSGIFGEFSTFCATGIWAVSEVAGTKYYFVHFIYITYIHASSHLTVSGVGGDHGPQSWHNLDTEINSTYFIVINMLLAPQHLAHRDILIYFDNHCTATETGRCGHKCVNVLHSTSVDIRQS